MITCERNDFAVVPQDGCPCRACFREREKSVPDAILKLVHPPRDVSSPYRISFAASTVNLVLNHYLSGRIPIHEMYATLIVALAKTVDTLGNEASKVVQSVPGSIIFPHPEAPWQAAADAKLNVWYEVAGPSGYMGVPIRIHVARLHDKYHNNEPEWRTHDGERFTDDGEPPTHFRELTVPEGY